MGITLNPGIGGNVLGTDQVAGTDYELVKLGVGAAGIAPTPVSASNPMPVTVAGGAVVGFQDGAAYSAGTTQGLAVMGLYSDSAVLASGQAGAPRLSINRQLLVCDQAAATGGATPFSLLPANSNNATLLKASPGTLYSIEFFNVTATLFYVKFYNKITAPAPAGDSAILIKVIPVPANANGAGVVASWTKGINFSTGIAFAIVAGIGVSDNTSVPANCGYINGSYF